MATTPLTDTISEVANAPKMATVDGVTVQSQDLAQLIAADRYLTQKAAAQQSPSRLLRRTKIKPPGPVT